MGCRFPSSFMARVAKPFDEKLSPRRTTMTKDVVRENVLNLKLRSILNGVNRSRTGRDIPVVRFQQTSTKDGMKTSQTSRELQPISYQRNFGTNPIGANPGCRQLP